MGVCAYRQHDTGTRCATWHNWRNWHNGDGQHGIAMTLADTGVSRRLDRR